MVASFDVKIDTSSLDAGLQRHLQQQLPYAASVALNATAAAVLAAEVQSMRSSFDDPVPYTLNSMRVVRATKLTPVAQVRFKDGSGSGRSAEKYLAPETFGGDRNVKGIEEFLRARGLLPSDMYLMPGDGATLDSFGNFSRAQYTQIIRQLSVSNTKRKKGRPRAGTRRANPTIDVRYFIGRPGGGRQPLGVWARYEFAAGYAVRPILIFARKPAYVERFPFYDVAQSAVAETFPTAMQAAWQSAVATAR